MNVIEVLSLKWLDAEQTRLGGDIVTAEYGPVPICITENYDVEYGRILWADALAGKYGPINKYSPPPAPTPQELRERMLPLSALDLRDKMRSIGLSSSTVAARVAEIDDTDMRDALSDYWERGTSYRRLDTRMEQLGSLLGLSPEEIDKLWT